MQTLPYSFPETDIYLTGMADAILNPSNHSPEIRFYLYEEQQLLRTIIPQYDTIVEVGCIEGTYATITLEQRSRYIGIDKVNRFIASAKKRYPKATFICGDFCDIDHISEITLCDKLLFVLPFNSFGNVKHPAHCFEMISRYNADFIISTYNNRIETQAIRHEYYSGGGFTDLTCITNKLGVRFLNDDGLNSIAHSAEWFGDKGIDYNLRIIAKPLGNVGVAYSNINMPDHRY